MALKLMLMFQIVRCAVIFRRVFWRFLAIFLYLVLGGVSN